MDIHQIATWSIVLLITATLIIIPVIRSKKKKNRILADLTSFALENKSNISSYDTWENTLLGINQEMDKLFFIRKVPDREIRQAIDLKEVSDCSMQKAEKRVSYQKEVVHVIDKIELLLSFHHQKASVSLEFYNADYNNLTLTGELQLAQKWMGIVKSQIPAKSKGKTIPLNKNIANPENDHPNPFLSRRAG